MDLERQGCLTLGVDRPQPGGADGGAGGWISPKPSWWTGRLGSESNAWSGATAVMALQAAARWGGESAHPWQGTDGRSGQNPLAHLRR